MRRVLIKSAPDYVSESGFTIEFPEYKGFFIKWDHAPSIETDEIVPVGLIEDDEGNVLIAETHRIKFTNYSPN